VKITEVGQTFGTFSPRESDELVFHKKWLRLDFGRFIKNSSGHPASKSNVTAYQKSLPRQRALHN
jgi:hypothetical protein